MLFYVVSKPKNSIISVRIDILHGWGSALTLSLFSCASLTNAVRNARIDWYKILYRNTGLKSRSPGSEF